MRNVYLHFNNIFILNQLRYMPKMQSNDTDMTDVICLCFCIIHEISYKTI